VRYRHRRPDDAELREELRKSAEKHRRFGYRRLHVILRRDGHVLNRKRTQRLYREEGLAVRRRRGRKRALGTRAPLVTDAVVNARWSVDFMQDQFADGRRFRILNVLDDVTKECLASVVDTSISGRRAARELTKRIDKRGKPGVIVSDNGTEFTSNAILAWAEKAQVKWHDIAPGKPMQNDTSCGRVIGPPDRCLFRPHLQRPDAGRAPQRDPVLRNRPRPRGRRRMGHDLQHRAPPLRPRISDPKGVRRPAHRNGRSAPPTRTAAPIAHCSVGATAPSSTADSGLNWMSIGGHSTSFASWLLRVLVGRLSQA
jgi:putative transposase